MKTIYKYRISRKGKTVLNLPVGAEVTSFQIQHGQLNIWALVDHTQETQSRCFQVIETGEEIDNYTESFKFIGTVQLDSGNIVVHLFEI